MGNPVRGEASFEALGKVWTLRFNTNALCEFEAASGVPISAVSEGGIRMSHLRALAWAGLGFHHRKTRGSLDDIGNMIDEMGAQELAGVVMSALSSAFPSKEGGANSPPMAAQETAGSAS